MINTNSIKCKPINNNYYFINDERTLLKRFIIILMISMLAVFVIFTQGVYWLGITVIFVLLAMLWFIILKPAKERAHWLKNEIAYKIEGDNIIENINHQISRKIPFKKLKISLIPNKENYDIELFHKNFIDIMGTDYATQPTTFDTGSNPHKFVLCNIDPTEAENFYNNLINIQESV